MRHSARADARPLRPLHSRMDSTCAWTSGVPGRPSLAPRPRGSPFLRPCRDLSPIPGPALSHAPDLGGLLRAVQRHHADRARVRHPSRGQGSRGRLRDVANRGSDPCLPRPVGRRDSGASVDRPYVPASQGKSTLPQGRGCSGGARLSGMGDPPEPSPEQPIGDRPTPAASRRQYVKSGVLLAITAVSLYLLLPSLLSVLSSWPSLRASRLAFRGPRAPVRVGELDLSVGTRPDRVGVEGVVHGRVRATRGERARTDHPGLGDPVHRRDAAQGRDRWRRCRCSSDRVDGTPDRNRPGATCTRGPCDARGCAG